MGAHFPHLAYLEALRPPDGWKTDHAIISTYSAQVPVIAATLMALAGEVDEAGSGSRVGLVRSFMALRKRVHIVVQSGRLTLGRYDGRITALLDRFLVQVPWDETAVTGGKSWHAKFVLVRQVPMDPDQTGERWVFMLGSRNLTLNTSWDIGYLVQAGTGANTASKQSLRIPGIAQLASTLAGEFLVLKHPWSKLAKGLEGVNWQVSVGIKEADLRLMLNASTGRGLPALPRALKRLVAISPFLDSEALITLLARLAKSSEVKVQLLSTRTALQKALQTKADLSRFQLLVLPEPAIDVITEATFSDEEDLDTERIGLHAKILYAEHGEQASIWLGSPNLTSRAWNRNAELVLRLETRTEEATSMLRSGIDALLDRANPVDAASLRDSDVEKTPAEILEEARGRIAFILAEGSQTLFIPKSIILRCKRPPILVDSTIRLQCAQVSGNFRPWLPGKVQMELAVDGVISDCISCSLEYDGHSLEWVQLVPFKPALEPDERDAEVLTDYLGSRQMLAWIHSVLSGYSEGDEGGAWDADAPSGISPKPPANSPSVDLPTIEQALRMWLKSPGKLKEVDRILELRRSSQQAVDEGQQALERFASTWKVIRDSLPDKMS